MRFHRFALVLIPVGPLVVGFGGCGTMVNDQGGYGQGGYATSVNVGSSSSSSGLVTTTGGARAGGQIAATCATDTDCGGDLECLLPDGADPIFGGGAPGGFCTKDCKLDADCAKEGGICYQPDPSQPGRCTLACGLGPPITGVAGLFNPLRPVKCRARDDVRCIVDAGPSSEGACLPTCGSDAQCSDARCDPRAVICVPTPSTGQPTGTACDPTAEPSVCAGLCVGFQTGAAMCSEPCVLGGAGLGSPDCGGPDAGLCAFHPATNGAGDTGFCTPSCAVQSDCQTPSFWCFGVPPLTDTLHRGYCFAATPCPNGPSDCPSPGDASAENPVYTCTMTTAGPLCLDATFPLYADAGSGDAGSTDASTLDAGPGDGGSPDAGPVDAGPSDAGPSDAGPVDAGPSDAGPSDAGPSDAGPSDAGAVDAGSGDGGSLDDDGGDGGDGG